MTNVLLTNKTLFLSYNYGWMVDLLNSYFLFETWQYVVHFITSSCINYEI